VKKGGLSFPNGPGTSRFRLHFWPVFTNRPGVFRAVRSGPLQCFGDPAVVLPRRLCRFPFCQRIPLLTPRATNFPTPAFRSLKVGRSPARPFLFWPSTSFQDEPFEKFCPNLWNVYWPGNTLGTPSFFVNATACVWIAAYYTYIKA